MYDDGLELPCDAVVFATGYDVRRIHVAGGRPLRGRALACTLLTTASRCWRCRQPQIAFPYLDPLCGVTVVRNEVGIGLVGRSQARVACGDARRAHAHGDRPCNG